MASQLHLISDDGEPVEPVEAVQAPPVWCPPDELPPEAIELLGVLRRWPCVPMAVTSAHAAALVGGARSKQLVELLIATPEDKRRAPYLGMVHEHKVFWVTTAGHSACGSSRRTSAPGIAEIEHSMALAQIAYDWTRQVRSVVGSKFNRGLADEFEFEVHPGAAYVQETLGGTTYIENQIRYAPAADLGTDGTSVKARMLRAWSGKSAVPDLVVVEQWWPLIEHDAHAVVGPHLAEARAWRERLWPHTGLLDRAPEWAPLIPRKRGWDVVAVEIERTKKSTTKLRDKVAAHAAAIELGAWDAVLWLTDDEAVARAIARAKTAALDTELEHAQQPIISTHTVSPAAARSALGALGAFGWATQASGLLAPPQTP